LHVAGETWYCDVSCDPESPLGSILYMHEYMHELICTSGPRRRRHLPGGRAPGDPHASVSGRKALFVNRAFTTRIPQLSRNESAPVLRVLYGHIETPEFKCRFRWRVNSVALRSGGLGSGTTAAPSAPRCGTTTSRTGAHGIVTRPEVATETVRVEPDVVFVTV
jgi:hypothetical protein